MSSRRRERYRSPARPRNDRLLCWREGCHARCPRLKAGFTSGRRSLRQESIRPTATTTATSLGQERLLNEQRRRAGCRPTAMPRRGRSFFGCCALSGRRASSAASGTHRRGRPSWRTSGKRAEKERRGESLAPLTWSCSGAEKKAPPPPPSAHHAVHALRPEH